MTVKLPSHFTPSSALLTSTQTQDEVQRRLLLDVVVAQGPSILQLLAGKDQSLLVRRDTLLVLDLRFDVVDRVGGFDFESDGLSSKTD